MHGTVSRQTSPNSGHDLGRIPVLAPEANDTKETAVPSLVSEVLHSPGRPVDAATRAFFEPRFGRDFGHVRVHTDERAGASARSVDAEAYNVGSHVAFAPRAFRPESEQGRRLIAHELAHVVQQRDAGPGAEAPVVNRISRPGERAEEQAEAASAQVLSGLTPSLAGVHEGGVLHRADGDEQPAPAQPFYQEAIDALAEERQGITSTGMGQITPSSVTALEKLVALCQALERGEVGEVQTALREFLALEPLYLPNSTPSVSLVNEMVSRIMMLGLDAESENLRRWSLKREKQIRPVAGREFARELAGWEALKKRLLDAIPEAGGAAGLRALDGLIVLLAQLVREGLSLDEEEIKSDRKKGEELKYNFFYQQAQPTIAAYADELFRLIKETFVGVQTAFQVVLDQAVEDLAAGRGGAVLRNAEERLNRLGSIEPADASRRFGGVTVETTRSEFEKGGGVHLDAPVKTEAQSKERSVEFNFYDANQRPEDASEMSSDFHGVFQARQRQIEAIKKIYGLQRGDKGDLTPESRENAAAAASLGAEGLRLHSDDDWRKFVLEKFNLREATDGPAEALVAVMDLLQTYLRAFTSHTPYDIDDFGDDLLTKTFPRDLTGRLIHDCGVYGLRMAYILSLLRDHPKLQLSFRYVVMPVHVGLLITGDNLPTFLVNNDAVTTYDAAKVEEMRGAWGEFDEQGQKRTPEQPAAAEDFSGELMANAFLPGVDLPYKEAEVVKAAGSTERVKAQLWQQYTSAIAPTSEQLFGPSVRDPASPNYQFHLRYLKLLDLIKKHYNTQVLPFWNDTAAGLWDAHQPAIRSAYAALVRADPDDQAKEQAAYDAAVKVYADALKEQLEVVKASASARDIADEQEAINDYIAAHPEVFAPGTEVENTKRVKAMLDSLKLGDAAWERAIKGHLTNLELSTSIEAPFERPEQKLMPLN